MASFDQHNRESQHKPGIIQKILNLLSITMPKSKSSSSSRFQSIQRSQNKSQPVKAKASSHAETRHTQAKSASHKQSQHKTPQAKKSAQASEHKVHAKATHKPEHKVHAKASHKPEHKTHAKASHKPEHSAKHKAKSASRRHRPKHHAVAKTTATKTDHSLHNPKDVIPHDSHASHDPAHSSGHRKVHIEKDLH